MSETCRERHLYKSDIDIINVIADYKRRAVFTS